MSRPRPDNPPPAHASASADHVGQSSRTEWSRSRYWLCHFLDSRHRRIRIAPTPPGPAAQPTPAARRALVRFLAATPSRTPADHHWLIEEAQAWTPDDPAFVQCIRLLTKEQRYHDELVAKHCGPPPRRRWVSAALRPIRRRLGVRFELSRLLLAQFARLQACRLLRQRTADPTLAAVCLQIERDAHAHVHFLAERLTHAYADFNFVRRNLRRWRLRTMLVLELAWAAAAAGDLIHCARGRSAPIAWRWWRRFNGLLSEVVPYRRRTLLQALLSQRDAPFADLSPYAES